MHPTLRTRFSAVASLAAVGLLTLAPGLRAQSPTTNPFPNPILKGSLAADVRAFATLPNSGNNLPARANSLSTAPDGRIFVNDQRGSLYSLSPGGAVVTRYLNLTDSAYALSLLSDDGERGFQTFTFHPDFNTRGAAGYGRFYTVLSTSNLKPTPTFSPGSARDHDEILLEWTAKDASAATFTPANAAAPFRELLRIARPNSNHNAGNVAFNPTAAPGTADYGKLYLGTGDSGGGGDPLGLAQMSGNAYGAILRIDPLGTNSANGKYGIPSDNPFSTNPAFLKERWAGGFRNPQRFTWDEANGRMFVADIGQNAVEEIDLGKAGANYGWNNREGSFAYDKSSGGVIPTSLRGDAASTGYTYPIAEYDHSEGNAVTTGPVFRGNPAQPLNGRLIFGDFPTGRVFTLDAVNLPDGGQDPITELRLRLDGVETSFLNIIKKVNPNASRADVRFGRDESGRTFLLNKQDGVVRLLVPPSAVKADFNGDGQADFVWQNLTTGERVIWFCKNGQYQSGAYLPGVPVEWSIAGAADFDGDGQADLVWQNTRTGQRDIWLMKNGVLQSAFTFANIDPKWSIAGVADFNGDGQADLVWQNLTTGERVIWFLKNGQYQSGVYLPTIDPAWSIAGAGDLDGDGQADIVWQNPTTGERVFWLLKNGVFAGGASLGTYDPAWRIAGVADLNGDGFADLVWENITTGDRVAWFLRSGEFQSGAYLPTIDKNWHIADH